jgi:hypothetical protein
VNGDASQQEQTERQSVHEHNAKTDTWIVSMDLGS